ncbi:unnamed protein product [Darwinula stevensoni]|uniref:Uncharacterized protein n=1 Tax=Darwinula stevensoni TaxID=69355 RepID=A0A7R9A9J2_9CRUS|nr:unnamed protein product [Darwinula stevensoni]CAG0897405.1 unnamed protein product [Darwinula stevensoni]
MESAKDYEVLPDDVSTAGAQRSVYLNPPNQWVKAALESRELLAMCLKRLKGLNQVHLVDASFVWTEPHSKRIKLKLKIQKEVLNGAILEQTFIVEFTVASQMCDGCRRVENKDYWKALVQVRQKAEHKRTFYYLEQLILKHNAHENTIGIQPKHDGLDFFYASENLAKKMVDFLTTVVPCRWQQSKELISHDIRSNTYHYKYTYSVEIVPVCKDNVVCLPKQLAHNLGGMNPICIVSRVTHSIHLIDPQTAQVADLNGNVFWRSPFQSLCSPKQLTEFMVMNVEIIPYNERTSFPGQGPLSNKHQVADIWVVKSSELGMEPTTVHTRSHMGHILKPGDLKVYADKALRNRRRKWKLRHMQGVDDADAASDNREYTDFLEDLEEDPLIRQGVNIYKDPRKMAVDTDDMDDTGTFQGLAIVSVVLVSFASVGALSTEIPNQPTTPSPQTPENKSLANSSNTSTTPLPVRDATPCVVGMFDCQEYEECTPVNNKSKNGLCYCVKGYQRDSMGTCVQLSAQQAALYPDVLASSGEDLLEETDMTKTTTTTERLFEKLIVSVMNKTIQLPENSTSLSVVAIPSPPLGTSYEYRWVVVSRPPGDDSGTMSNTNSNQMKLSKLKAGTYLFNVSVSGEYLYGDAMANLTVLPPIRRNLPPVAMVNPKNQTLILPNMAVLDASASQDDDKIVSYHWDLITSPVDNQVKNLPDEALIKLESLSVGTYQLNLTVTDSDGATNWTVAYVNVQKAKDYPPTANAGKDQIIFLPQNFITLNGNASTDDKGIKEWEWTKGLDTQDLAVDMQETNSPFLRLSNLKEGMYTFQLKVTDTADQTDSVTVRVFVKTPANDLPVVNTGPNITITLPERTAILNGSLSVAPSPIKFWNWTLLSGPTNVSLEHPNEPVTKVSGLGKGVYIFNLTVSDGQHNASGNVSITVIQTKNNPPKADAGGDRHVTLPLSSVTLDGSKSSDDVGIIKWLWTFEDGGLAAATIIAESDHTPHLILTGLEAGRYMVSLQVTDTDGVDSPPDTVSIVVSSSPNINDEVELVLSVPLNHFTVRDEKSLIQKLELLLPQEGKQLQVKSLKLYPSQLSGMTVFRFLVLSSYDSESAAGEKEWKPLEGLKVEQWLRKKLRLDESFLDWPVFSVDAVICQNPCSYHGKCDQATRECICDSFWVQNPFRRHLGDKERNCDWSIIYVLLVIGAILAGCYLILWWSIKLCRRHLKRKVKRRHRYSLLNSENEETELHTTMKVGAGSLMLSESDSDSDVVYEAHKRKSGSTNGHVCSNGLSLS